jgi:hypothetical protein
LRHFSVLGAKELVLQITFQGLTTLSNGCPNLSFVGVIIDGCLSNLMSEHLVMYPNIQTLCFSRSIIDAPLKIFKYVFNVFSNLVILGAWNDLEDMDHPQHLLWKMVMNLRQRK